MSRARRILVAAALVGALAATISGCASNSSDPPPGRVPAATPTSTSTRVVDDVELPPTTGAADYQLGGAYAPPSGVTVVTRDSTDEPATGVYSICYVNGFQTQPGVKWPDDLILHTASGAPLVDPGWPDEHIIDISTAAKRAAAAARIAKTTDLCQRKGFAAVEFDNLDSYSRSKKQLTLSNAVSFATLLVQHADDDGLAAGQKNTAQLGSRGRDEIGYDFAVSEECDTYSECGAFTRVYGRRMIDIEYTDDLRGTFAQVCARRATPPMTILRDRDLTTPSSPAYVYRHC